MQTACLERPRGQGYGQGQSRSFHATRVLLQGLRFAFREGGKTVGAGVVSKVLD